MGGPDWQTENFVYFLSSLVGFPCSSVGKESACHTGDLSLIPGSGRSPGKGNGKPLQYSCLGNPMDRGAWQATVHVSYLTLLFLELIYCLWPSVFFFFFKDGNRYPCFKSFLVFPCLLALLSEILLVFLNKFS